MINGREGIKYAEGTPMPASVSAIMGLQFPITGKEEMGKEVGNFI